MIKKQLILIICIAFLFAPNLWSAQVAIVSTDTRQEAWAKETLNNSDLQTNIDGKLATAGDGSSLTGLQFDQFITQTAWRVFYSNTDGDVTELALGADGTYLMSNGAALAPTFETPAGSGDVTAAAVITDHSIVRGDGGAKGVQDSGVLIDDSDNVSGITDIEVESLTIPQSATAQEIVVFEASGDGTNKHTITAQAMASDRASLWPDWVIGFLNSSQVNASGALADDTIGYTQTTGSFKALTPVSGSTTGFAAAFTGTNLYGGTYVVTSDTGDLVIPAMLINMSFTIITSGAIEVVADCNAADGYLLDGVTGAEGANITNLSTSGDIACYQYYTADDWLITTNGWTAE